jgi:hypothetical protein
MPVQTQMQVRRGTASSWTSTNPTLAAGELGFETDTGKFKIGNGSSTWTALLYAGGGQSSLTTYQYTATATQTTFSGVDANGNTLAYTVGAVQVYLNGALLQNTADYAATNGTSVVLTTGALVGDSLTIISFATFDVANTYTQAQADALFIADTIVDAKGDIIAATAADTVSRLAVGANDTVLTADSATATGLKWAAASSGGMTSIASGSLTGSSVSITSIPGTYQNLQLVLSNIGSTSGATVQIRLNNDSGSNYSRVSARGTSLTQLNTQTQFQVGNPEIPAANNGMSAVVNVYNYANSTTRKIIDGLSYVTSNASDAGFFFGGHDVTAATTSLQIINSGSTFSSGTYILYGVK